MVRTKLKKRKEKRNRYPNNNDERSKTTIRGMKEKERDRETVVNEVSDESRIACDRFTGVNKGDNISRINCSKSVFSRRGAGHRVQR